MGEKTKLPKILMQDFTRYLDAKSAKSPCSRCGSFEWTIFTDPDNPEYASMGALGATDPDQLIMAGRFYPFVVYYCRNCSNSYFHAWHVVADWISKNPVVKEDT